MFRQSLRRSALGGSALLYLVVAAVGSALNIWSLNQAKPNLTRGEFDDVVTVLSGFTAVSILSLVVQFILGRTSSQGKTIPAWAAVTASVALGVAVGVTAFLAISSSDEFRREIALWLAALTFLTLAPAGEQAALLKQRRWGILALLALVGPVVRALLWVTESFSGSATSLLAALASTQFLVTVATVLVGRRDSRGGRPRPALGDVLIPAGVLGGFIGLVGASFLSRRTTLGAEAAAYSSAMFTGRTIIFGSAVVAYLLFPDFFNESLFSIRLSKRLRLGMVAIALVSVGLGVVALVGNSSTADVYGTAQDNVDTSLLVIVVVGWVFLSLALLPVFYLAAHGSRFGLATVLAAAAMVMSQFVLHTANSLAVAFCAISVLLLAAVALPFVARSRTRVSAQLRSATVQQPIMPDGLTVVVPSYNPGAAVIQTVKDIHEVFSERHTDVRVIVVSDGSTDESIGLLNDFRAEWFLHLPLASNEGKGAALRAGFRATETQYAAFIDADGDIPPRLLPGMYDVAVVERADVVFGSKWHPESELEVSKARWLLSKIHHFLQVVLFNIDIDDTQAGIKLYRTALLREVEPSLKETGFSLDLEIFVAAAARGHKRFFEVPLVISRTGSSTIAFKHVIRSFFDMLAIFWRAKVALEYLRASVDEERSTEESIP